MTTALAADIEREIARDLPDLVRIRRELHAHPQFGYEETFAAELVQRELAARGVPFQAGVAKTGVVGWLLPDRGGAEEQGVRRLLQQEKVPDPSFPAGAVALRADMDALPLDEATGLPYASGTPGVMHACGHDGHVAMLIGAARALERLRDRLPRPVKLLFQPAEERLGGAAKMVEAGALDERIGGVKVAVIFALHGFPGVDLGAVATRSGPIMSGADNFDILVRGRGGHGAIPQLAADPVLAAAHVVTALQSIASRNVDPTASAVVTVGKLHAGTAFNIIPQTAHIEGTVRTFEPAVAELVHGRIKAIAEQVAGGLGCSADVRIVPYYPVTANDPRATEFFLRVARGVLGEPAVRLLERPEMGSEDFSFYARKVPGCYFLLGLHPPGAEPLPPNHSPLFDFNDLAIGTGVKLLVALALSS